MNGAAGVHTCATSREAVPVTDFEYIEDVYESIVSYAGSGRFVYERYEDLKRGNLLNDPDSPGCRFVREKFPQYWKEAQVLDAHGLF